MAEPSESAWKKTIEWPLRTAVFVIGLLSIVIALLFIAYFLSMFFDDWVNYAQENYYLDLTESSKNLMAVSLLIKRASKRMFERMCVHSRYSDLTTPIEDNDTDLMTGTGEGIRDTTMSLTTRGDGRPIWYGFTTKNGPAEPGPDQPGPDQPDTDEPDRRRNAWHNMLIPFLNVHRTESLEDTESSEDTESPFTFRLNHYHGPVIGGDNADYDLDMTTESSVRPVVTSFSNRSLPDGWGRMQEVVARFLSGRSFPVDIHHPFTIKYHHDPNATEFNEQEAWNQIEKTTTRALLPVSYEKLRDLKPSFEPIRIRNRRNAALGYITPPARGRQDQEDSAGPDENVGGMMHDVSILKDHYPVYNHTLCLRLKKIIFRAVDDYVRELFGNLLDLSRGRMHTVLVVLDLLLVVLSCLFLISCYFFIVGARRKSRSMMVGWVCAAGVAIYAACIYDLCHHFAERGVHLKGSLLVGRIVVVIGLVVLHAIALFMVDKYYRTLYVNERKWVRSPQEIDIRR